MAKLRSGFVSNSSTSSYIVITTVECFDKTMEQLGEYAQELARAVTKVTDVLGRKVMFSSIFCGMGGEGTLDYLPIGSEPNDDVGRWETWDLVVKKLKENGPVFTRTDYN